MSITEPKITAPLFQMNTEIPCNKGDHKWMPWLHVSQSIYRTICPVCKLTCSYVEGEWQLSQR